MKMRTAGSLATAIAVGATVLLTSPATAARTRDTPTTATAPFIKGGAPTPKVKVMIKRKYLKKKTLVVTIKGKGVKLKVNKYGNLLIYKGKRLSDGLGPWLVMSKNGHTDGIVKGKWKVKGSTVTFIAKKRNLNDEARLARGCSGKEGAKELLKGAAGGLAAGIGAGLLGGPLDPVTVPAGILSGTLLGAFGGSAGYWATCWW